MKKFLISIVVLFVLIAGGLFAVAALAPMDKIKAEAVRAVKSATGRDLAFSDAKISIWPQIGLTLQDATFSNAEWSDEKSMASLKGLDIRLAVMPLLQKKVEVSKVVLVEPGPITSRIRANSIPHFERWIDWENSPRAEQYRRSLLRRLYQPAARKDRFELPPRAVSERIAHALEAANPRPRYYVTVPTRISGIARRLLPTRGLDWVTRRG